MPGFARLLTTYALNDLGDQVGLVAAAILVLDRTRSPLAAAALFVFGRALPAVFAPPFSAVVDRFAPRRVLPLLYLVEAVAFVGLAVLSHHFWLPAVLAIAFADGVVALAARGVTRGTIALALRPSNLVREGNNIVNIVFSVSNMIGPVTGGLIVAAGGAAWGLGIDAGLFVLMALILALPGRWPARNDEPHDGWQARLVSGLRYARATPGVGGVLLADAASLIPLTLVVPVTVVLAKNTLHAGDSGYGLLQSAWGVGIVIGGLLLLRGGSIQAIIGTGLLAIGVAYIAIGIAPDLALACIASVVGGIGNGVQSATVTTAVQLVVDDAFMGRISALFESVIAGTMGIGYALGGAVTDIFDARTSYVVAGCGVILCMPLLIRAVRVVPAS